MNPVFFHISGFLLCTAIIVYSGTRLARYGDAIAELTGWGKAWVGLISC
jgi:cation:H+ antiporter